MKRPRLRAGGEGEGVSEEGVDGGEVLPLRPTRLGHGRRLSDRHLRNTRPARPRHWELLVLPCKTTMTFT